MSEDYKTISDQNFVTTSRGVLTIEMLREESYTFMSFPIPGISTSSPRQATPFTDIPHSGDKLIYEPLTVEFIVKSDLSNWLGIYNWLVANTYPTDFADMDKFPSEMSDANVIIYSAHNNPQINVNFKNLVPTSLSEVRFNTGDNDTTFITASATFDYQSYDIEVIPKRPAIVD